MSFVDAAERRRIEGAAQRLGVERPIEGDALRQVDGRCVFLSPDRRCLIHAALGAEVKPKVCQQFPKRATLTEGGYRVGADPSCTSTIRSFRDGPEIDPLPAMQEERRLPADVAQAEAGLIRLASAPGASVAFVVGHFTGDPRFVPRLPPAFASRACAVLRDMDLASVAGLHGPDVAARLAHVAPRIAGLDPATPPPWHRALGADEEAFALEVLRRQLFLRLGDPAVPPFAQALLVLLGALAAGWSEPVEERTPDGAGAPARRFGPALSAWARLVRTARVWQRLLPDLERARWLVTG